MSELNAKSNSWSLKGSISLRLIALLGVVSPIQCVLIFTLAGFLRPGYSPIHNAISALGVGQNSWILNTDLIISGLLFIVFAIGFYMWMCPIINRGWLLASTILLVLSAAGVVNEGIFHQPAHGDPAAHFHMVLHGIGLAVLFYSLIIALLILGWHFRKIPDWRVYGWYLLLTAFATLGLLILPTQIAYSGHIWGFIERVQVFVGFSWSVVIGWRLYTYRLPISSDKYGEYDRD
ncbi:MAG: DUF998 domain-containing protein [Ktedonobacteraceae bacterium]